jgi:hypothetical protein
MAGRDRALISGSILGFAKRVGNPPKNLIQDNRTVGLEFKPGTSEE